jgi:hypothetical protein
VVIQEPFLVLVVRRLGRNADNPASVLATTRAATGVRNAHASVWKKIKLPSTIAIKHQIRKLMFEDLLKEVEVIAKAEAIRRSLSKETLNEREQKQCNQLPDWA